MEVKLYLRHTKVSFHPPLALYLLRLRLFHNAVATCAMLYFVSYLFLKYLVGWPIN